MFDTVLMMHSRPLQMRSWSLSGPQTTQYTGAPAFTMEERSIPVRDQTCNEARRVGEWESGRVGEWESGRVEREEEGTVTSEKECEDGRVNDAILD